MQQIEMGTEVETGWRVTSADRTKVNKARSMWPPPQWIPVVTFALFSLAIGRVIVECSSLKVRLKVRRGLKKGSMEWVEWGKTVGYPPYKCNLDKNLRLSLGLKIKQF